MVRMSQGGEPQTEQLSGGAGMEGSGEKIQECLGAIVVGAD